MLGYAENRYTPANAADTPGIGLRTYLDTTTGRGAPTLANSAGLDRFRQKLLAAATGIVDVNCHYDSITLGTGSGATSTSNPVDADLAVRSYAGRLSVLLAAIYNTLPGGYMAADDGRTTVVGGTKQSSLGPVVQTVRVADTPTNGGAISLTAGQTISFAVPISTRIELIYFSSAGVTAAGGISGATGTFSYTVDGAGGATSVVEGTYPIKYERFVASGLAATTHTVLVTGVTGVSYICGILYSGDTGFRVNRFGWGGTTLFDMRGNGPGTGFSAAGQQRVAGFVSRPGQFQDTVVTKTGSPEILTVDSSNYKVGQPVGAAAGLTLPAYVKSIDSATKVTLTTNATADNAARAVFVGSNLNLTGDLWIFNTTHNDWRLQNSLSGQSRLPAYLEELQYHITRVTAEGGCCLLVGEPFDTSTAPSPEYFKKVQYWNALNDLARANTHCSAIQMGQTWKSFDIAVGNGYQLTDVHPTNLGYGSYASNIFQMLVG